MTETASKQRLAVVLYNLGGPDKAESIRPFLLNFFNDPLIIRAPLPVRKLVAWLIARRRSKKEAHDSYAVLGGGSPLLANTELQARALETALLRTGHDVKTFVCMRYWHPMADDVAAAVKRFNPDHIVMLPLYPQFSTTTTLSSFRDWKRAAKKTGLSAPATEICCYPFLDGFIAASAALVRTALETAQAANPGQKMRVLFSAHGLPQKVIDAGDPYQWQCEEGARRIAAAAGLADDAWQICYQSRVGPMKWIGPSTEDALQTAAADAVGVVIYPHAFVSEHVETLVEIEEEYRHLATTLGVPAFARVPTVSVNDDFINALAALVSTAAGRLGAMSQDGPVSLCPGTCNECYLRLKDATPCAC